MPAQLISELERAHRGKRDIDSKVRNVGYPEKRRYSQSEKQ